MGVDEKITYSITVSNGQVNIANDNASITATNTIGVDLTELETLLQNVRLAASDINGEDAEVLSDSLEVIDEQIKSKNPKKGFIKTVITGIKAIKGTVEFATAVATLIQFIQTVI